MNSQRGKNNTDQKAVARARRFLEERGIDVTTVIHHEDAVRMMVQFSVHEQELAEQLAASRQVMQKRAQGIAEARRKLKGCTV